MNEQRLACFPWFSSIYPGGEAAQLGSGKGQCTENCGKQKTQRKLENKAPRCALITSGLRKLRKEDDEFKDSIKYLRRPHQKDTNTTFLCAESMWF